MRMDKVVQGGSLLSSLLKMVPCTFTRGPSWKLSERDSPLYTLTAPAFRSLSKTRTACPKTPSDDSENFPSLSVLTPWKGCILPPSAFHHADTSAPATGLPSESIT